MKICPNHQNYKVPLIWTFAFPHKEYWCPYCGYTVGMLGIGDSINVTKAVTKRLSLYEKFSVDFIHATGVLSCCETTWKGERIKPQDLPKKEKQRLAKIRENWKYKIKLEKTK